MTPPADNKQPADPLLRELGAVGLKRTGGTVAEEYLPQLQGARGLKVYQEMANDPLIGGVLLALQEVIGRLAWEFVPPENATAEELDQATFVQQCLEDMNDSWDVTLNQILSSCTYGWAFMETVYKRRTGPSSDPSQRSRFTDGRIGWRKFALRSQDTLAEWIFDENGGLRGMAQNDLYTGHGVGRRIIPIERGLLFRTDEYKGNPEGRSMLRSAYRPWYFKKRIEEIEAVGVERDFAGMPAVYAPQEWFEGENNAMLTMLRDTITKAKRNELDGVLLPAVYDEDGNQTLKFELLSTGGSRQFDTNAIVGRYNNAVATSMLMDFLTLGHEGVGSWALGTAKITMWQLVIESLAKSIAAVVNRHAVPRLMLLNGWRPDRMPELVFGDVAQADLTVLGDYLAKMIENGVIVPDARLENYVRELGGLPQADEVPAPDEGDGLLPEQILPDQPEAAPAPAPAPAATVPEVGGA